MVMQLPERDEISMSYEQMTSRLAIMMAGRVAEEQTFGEKNVTSGASSDIEQATRLARAMVTQWGYSEKLGKVAYGSNQQEVFLGHSVAQEKNVSEETAQIIDAEVRKLIDDAYEEATRILSERKDDLETLAQGPARIRDADRPGAAGPHRRQAAAPRHGRRHAPVARLRGALDRQAPPRPRARRGRPGAAAELMQQPS